jgi:LmbE family N-acetylglucosaminyl deacetylase
MNILAIGAHFDDVELGCGGALSRWQAEGHNISIYVATKSGYSAPDGTEIRSSKAATHEGEASAKLLNARLFTGEFETFEITANEQLHASLIAAIAKCQPQLIMTHWQHDTHHDHRELSLATLHVSRRVPRILAYRSNFYKAANTFNEAYFVDISSFISKKLELIRTFRSEHARAGENWESYFTASAAALGHTAGCAFAEAFELIKWVE